MLAERDRSGRRPMLEPVLPALIAVSQIVGSDQVVEADDEDAGAVGCRAASGCAAQPLLPEDLAASGIQAVELTVRCTGIHAIAGHERDLGRAAERTCPGLFAVAQLQGHHPRVVERHVQLVVADPGPDRRRADVLLPHPRAVGGAKSEHVAARQRDQPSVTSAQRGGDGHPRFPDDRSVCGTERDDGVCARGEEQTSVGRQRVGDLDFLAPSLASVGKVVRRNLSRTKSQVDQAVIADRRGAGNGRRADIDRPSQRQRQTRALIRGERSHAHEGEHHADKNRPATRCGGVKARHTL